MAAHDVLFKIPQKCVLAKDIEFEVRSDKAKLGTLLISKGNIEWVPANNSVNKFSLEWEKFSNVIVENGIITRIKK